MISLPITSVAAAILTAWFILLSARVISSRFADRVSLGTGDLPSLERRIRAHGNLAEYGPLGLILCALAEIQGAPSWLVALGAALLVVGRIMHGIALSYTKRNMTLRTGGMVLTFSALGVLALTALATPFIGH